MLLANRAKNDESWHWDAPGWDRMQRSCAQAHLQMLTFEFQGHCCRQVQQAQQQQQQQQQQRGVGLGQGLTGGGGQQQPSPGMGQGLGGIQRGLGAPYAARPPRCCDPDQVGDHLAFTRAFTKPTFGVRPYCALYASAASLSSYYAAAVSHTQHVV